MTAKKGLGTIHCALVGLSEVLEAIQSKLELLRGVAAGSRLQRVETAACQEEELVAQHLTDRTQFAAITVAGTQQGGAGIEQRGRVFSLLDHYLRPPSEKNIRHKNNTYKQ